MQAVPPVPLDDDDDDYYDFIRMDDDTTQRQIFANFAKLKRRESSDGSDDERERVKLAHETARLIQLEVQRWEASVAELEGSVLHQQQQLPGNRNNVVFPTMPAVVLDVMDDHCHPRTSAGLPLPVTVPPPPPPCAPLAVADWNESEEDDDVEMDEDNQDADSSEL